MENITFTVHIEKIRNLIHKDEFDGILQELKQLDDTILNAEIKDKISMLSSKFYAFQHNELFGKPINSWQKRELFQDTLYLTDEVEKLFHAQVPEIPNQNLSLYSDENVLKILNLFVKNSKDLNLHKEKIEDLYDTKVKLYNLLFKEFDSTLETNYKGEFPQILFDRILSFENIQKIDLDTIHSFRDGRIYSVNDRSLIVSALTISSITRFDPTKIHLLIDFLTDFEGNVWQKALVGLLLSLFKYNNRLSLYPAIERRLNELKTIDSVQEGIIHIERILRFRNFSLKDYLGGDLKRIANELRQFLNEEIEITIDDIEEIQLGLLKAERSSQDEAFYSLLNLDNFNELVDIVKKEKKVSLSIDEFIKYINYNKFVELAELNPLALNLNTAFYKQKSNWFKPFEISDEIKNKVVEEFRGENINIKDFIQVISKSNLANIDKYALMINISSFSEEIISMIMEISIKQEFIQNFYNMSTDAQTYLHIIKEIYRYQKFLNKSYDTNIFENKLELYNKSLLDKITDKVVNDKIKANALYYSEKYKESLEILLTIPSSARDFETVHLIIKNYIFLDDYSKAKNYIEDILTYTNKINIDTKAEVYNRICNIYLSVEDNEKYVDFLQQLLAIKEEIISISISGKFTQDIIIEKIVSLTTSSMELVAVYANKFNDFISSTFYIFYYFDVLLKYQKLPLEILDERLLFSKKNYDAVLQYIFSHPDPQDKIKTIISFVESSSITYTKQYTLSFLNEIYKILDLKYLISLSNENKYYEKIVKNLSKIYERIEPAIIDIQQQNKKVENVILPLKFSDEKFEVTMNVEQLLSQKSDSFIRRMIASVAKYKIEDYFNICCEDYYNNFQDFKTYNIATDAEIYEEAICTFLIYLSIAEKE